MTKGQSFPVLHEKGTFVSLMADDMGSVWNRIGFGFSLVYNKVLHRRTEPEHGLRLLRRRGARGVQSRIRSGWQRREAESYSLLPQW